MDPRPWTPPPDLVTSPDQIDLDARREIDLMHNEQILRCWKVPLGFLVLTNLRCIHVYHKPELFSRHNWRVGPTFLFYNLAPPQVILDRFVQLSERFDEGVGSARFLVHDAPEVAREIDAAREAGRREWAARRARAEADRARIRPPHLPPGTTVVVREIVKTPCVYCGNLVEVGRLQCPFCGAPQR